MEMDKALPSAITPFSWKRLLIMLTSVVGPGMMVMLADTDAGSVITAAQSGAQWGYRMILPQLILIPILYLVQEVTIRLGVATGKGHGDLIREKFGMGWALVSVCSLFLASIGALVTEFSGMAGVGELFGIPKWISVSIVTFVLIVLGLTGSYRKFERIGIAIGLLELLFIPAAFLAHPSVHEMAQGITSIPFHDRGYVFLLAANVGAVIMPWMVFYQQGAVIDKGLTKEHVKAMRFDTLFGSILTQMIMLVVVIAVAATIGKASPNQPLNTIQQISQGLEPFLGSTLAKITFGFGMLGAGFIASLVVSVAGAWGIGEAFGLNHSLNHSCKDAPVFYLVYTLAHIGGAILVLTSFDLVQITVDVEVMNAMLLPIVLGFLLALEAKALPPEWRMRGLYKYCVWLVSGLVMAFGLYMIFKAF
ncbi:divalent metal cation transporter [Fodinisporobacter ferrooxydans]|uniref:Divalent metal cation transporter n=1 Tax=Fodinisporobacter ferrooxydans TaxID=2901836 RepID=A0ABY4CJI4_9BACL|nr:divalent metal cation transporter [Alicyclobacillaceae bacterium MYW30-H2]